MGIGNNGRHRTLLSVDISILGGLTIWALIVTFSALSAAQTPLPTSASTASSSAHEHTVTEPLEAKAIVRMTPAGVEEHQLFRGPTHTTQSWRLCVVLPNVSDRFWDEVSVGIREESARLGAASVIYKASGYTEAGRTQQERLLLHRCGTGDFDAVLLSAVSRTGLHDAIQGLRDRGIVVIDFVNGYDPQRVDARAFLDNYQLGHATGVEIKHYLATQLKKQIARILWIPGPKGPDWAQRGDEGFRTAMAGTTAKIETLRLPPHHREQYRDLLQHFSSPRHYDIIVGSGTTSTAVYRLKNEGYIPKELPVFAYYATPDALTLLAQGHLLGTISNEPKMQGHLGVALAVGLLEKLPMPFQLGPEPVLLKPQGEHSNHPPSAPALRPTQ